MWYARAIGSKWACALFCASLALGCTTVPDGGNFRFKSAVELFEESAAMDWSTIPAEANQMTVLPVAFADAFRAATVSATQAQFNIEKIDARQGRLLALRDLRAAWNPGNPNSITSMRYGYLIQLREQGPKLTEVRIAAKVQAYCEAVSGAGRVFFAVTTFGITEAVDGANTWSANDRCKALPAGIWARRPLDSQQEMGQFMNFVRNNLLAAGLL